MTDPAPIACTLSAGDLSQRLDEIATFGGESLLGSESKDGVHTLRFRSDEGTRHRLEEIAAAEARCCPFLDLSIDERDDQLVLAIAAPGEGEAIADELARAFSAKR